MMNWLISANSNMYDHASSFAHFRSIDWRQGNVNFQINDTVYIYCTSPLQQIRYKCNVTAINKKSSDIRDDKDYWIDKEEYYNSLNGLFFNLLLLEEVDSNQLKLSELKKNGLKAAPQGPIKLQNTLLNYVSSIFDTANNEYFPETLVNSDEIFEGLKKSVSVNKYERSSIARNKCIESYKSYLCNICSFDFEGTYGELGEEFIHVHHITPIHTIGAQYKIDFKKDLVPVCPNCHAMLHRKLNGKYLTVDELKFLVSSRRNA